MKKVLSVVILIVAIFVSGVCDAFAHEDTKEVRMGTITGQVMVKGDGPMAKGMVFFFDEAVGPPPSATRYWRVPGDAFDIDVNGRFIAQIPEGKYYMGALKRKSGEPIGPPQNGDPFFISQDEKGKPILHSVKKGVAIDMGILEAVPFDSSTLAREGVSAIEGVILDNKGKPVEGMLVFAFTTQTLVGRPLFVSDRTDRDGKYLLRVNEGGKYYLRIRENYGGGPPGPGEVIGTYGDKGAVTVSLKMGERIKGVDIKVVRFPGRGPKGSSSESE